MSSFSTGWYPRNKAIVVQEETLVEYADHSASRPQQLSRLSLPSQTDDLFLETMASASILDRVDDLSQRCIQPILAPTLFEETDGSHLVIVEPAPALLFDFEDPLLAAAPSPAAGHSPRLDVVEQAHVVLEAKADAILVQRASPEGAETSDREYVEDEDLISLKFARIPNAFRKEEEDEIQRLHSENIPVSEITRVVNERFQTHRSVTGITKKISRMRRLGSLPAIKEMEKYSKAEDDLLIDLRKKRRANQHIAARLSSVFGTGRTTSSVRSRVELLQKRGVNVYASTRSPYSEEEVDAIIELYRKRSSIGKIAEHLSARFNIYRTYKSVWNRIDLLQKKGVLEKRGSQRGRAAGSKREREGEVTTKAKRSRE